LGKPVPYSLVLKIKEVQGPPYFFRPPEPVFVNVYGDQESIPLCWESVPGLLKRFTNMGSEFFGI
jgi:hypothetical protein